MSRTAVFGAVLALLLLSVLPLSRALLSSVLVDDGPDAPLVLTAEHYVRAFGSTAAGVDTDVPVRTASGRMKMLGNSVTIAGVAALLALLLGVPYAFLVARTDVPWRRFLSGAYLVPLVLPPLLVTIAWNLIPALEPSPTSEPAVPTAFGGIVGIVRAACVFALCYYPIVVLFTRRALLRVPASLEESARLAGGPRAALRHVVLPLAAPGMLAGGLFVFLFALNDFAVVDYLNAMRPLADQVTVYPFEAFTAWAKDDGPGLATALGLPLAVLGIGLLMVIHRLLGTGPRASIGTAYRTAAPWELGARRTPALTAALALLVLSVGVPISALIWRAGGLGNYREIWTTVATGPSSMNQVQWSLWFAIGAALIALPIAFVVAHRVARTGSAWLMALALLPLALPPIFLGAGYLRLLNHPAIGQALGHNPFLDPDSPRYGPVLLMAAKYLPFAAAALWAAFLEVDPRLEEAAANAGVRPLARALGVLEPLVRPAIGLSVVLIFVFALREIDTVVLLSTDTLMRKIYSMIHFQRDSQVAALCVILVLLQAVPFALLWILAPASTTKARQTAP